MATDAPYVRQNIPGWYQVSASELQVWKDGCKRKWGLRYGPDPLPLPPPQDSAMLGDEVHGVLEKYQKDGIAWDTTLRASPIAAKALAHLPAPHPQALTETEFLFDTTRTGDSQGAVKPPILWKGRRDLVVAPGGMFPGSPLTLIDYKTTGNLQYAKTEETLLEDPQAILYASQTMAEFEAPIIDLMWLYLPTGAGKAKPVYVRFDVETVKKQFRKLEVLATEVVHAYSRLTDAASVLEQLPPNPLHCDAYGGCPYRGTCKLDPLETEHAKIEEFMSFFPATPVAQAPGFMSPPAPAAFAPAVATPQVVVPVGQSPLPFSPPTQPTFPDTRPVITNFPSNGGINPPEQPSLGVIPPGAMFAGFAPPGTPPGTLMPVNQLSVPPAPVVVPPPAPTAPEAPKPKRTRRSPAEMAAARAAETQGITVVVNSPAPAAQVAQTVIESVTSAFIPVAPAPQCIPDHGRMFTLYVNCRPDGHVTDAVEFFQEANRKVCALFQVRDYKELDFGRGLRELALETGRLAQGFIDAGTLTEMYLDTTSPEGAAALIELSFRADVVVRPTR